MMREEHFATTLCRRRSVDDRALRGRARDGRSGRRGHGEARDAHRAHRTRPRPRPAAAARPAATTRKSAKQPSKRTKRKAKRKVKKHKRKTKRKKKKAKRKGKHKKKKAQAQGQEEQEEEEAQERGPAPRRTRAAGCRRWAGSRSLFFALLPFLAVAALLFGTDYQRKPRAPSRPRRKRTLVITPVSRKF